MPRSTGVVWRMHQESSFCDGALHHPRAGVGPPSRASTNPASGEEGSHRVQSPLEVTSVCESSRSTALRCQHPKRFCMRSAIRRLT